MKQNILNFQNFKIQENMNTSEQLEKTVELLLTIIENNIDGDVVEFGCHLGETSKYLMKTLLETNSAKKLFIFDSFEGLPETTEFDQNTTFGPNDLKSSEELLINNFLQNELPVPIIHKDWFENVPHYKVPQKVSFALFSGKFYKSIYNSFEKVFDKVSNGGIILIEDYDSQNFPGVKTAIQNFLKDNNLPFTLIKVTDELGLIIKGNSTVTQKEEKSTPIEEKTEVVQEKTEVVQEKTPPYESKTTIVSGLWDIGRGGLTEGWSRNFDQYLKKFEDFLKIPHNLIIFGDEELKKFVFERRNENNTQFITRDLSWFSNNDFYEKIQKIRTDPTWFNQVGWLRESTQAKLEMYNPLVMAKMFLLHDAKILDKFDSDYMFWLDAGITNTVHPGYFTHDLVLEKMNKITDKFMFICFPYETNTEIHGFKFDEICRYANQKVDRVARAGFFGGKKDYISEVNSTYYGLLKDSLSNDLMGTEESIFTIMTYLFPDLIDIFMINMDGLLGTFFEDMKNNVHKKPIVNQTISLDNLVDKISNKEYIPQKLDEEVAIYVIGFNSPNQFKTLIHSMMFYDKNFIDKTKKYLLDNSTDLSTTEQYQALCNAYGFEHVKKDNIGITGGRQWIAEHFNESGHKHYMFFEDDMFFHSDRTGFCRNGFNRYTPNLFDKVVKIMNNEKFDFLKFNFSEFFGDNGTQWSWYNVPQVVREKFFPEKTQLPKMGLDPNAPRTEFKNIKSIDGLSYITGDIYYSNWPQIVSKEGNKKCFIDTKFASPYEQTIMSFIFQETKKGVIKPGILLLTPTEHNRFDHYDASLRKEC
jgi:O-methyltransferase